MDTGLEALRDWHLPAPVSWWPPAPGWWLLGAVLLAALIGLLIWTLRRRKSARPRQAALNELDRCYARWRADGDDRAWCSELSALLRRVALLNHPRQQVAGLTGADWLAFLDATGGGDAFSNGVGRRLIDHAFRATVAEDFDGEALHALAREWIERNLRPESAFKRDGRSTS